MGRIEDSLMIPDDHRPRVRSALQEMNDRVGDRKEPHCEYVYVYEREDGRLIVRQYENGRLHMQGSSSHLHDAVRQVVLAAVGEGDPTASSDNLAPWPHGGSDEAGKGDVFGPLVVAAVYVTGEDAEQLRAAGVTDSKRLTDRRCRALAQQVRGLLPDRWVTATLLPVCYNSLYRRCRERGHNLNHLLATTHADCIRRLLHRLNTGGRPTVVVDKFAREELLSARLVDREMQLLQVERGERDPAVAAASVLARAEFLRGLGQLSEIFDCQLPKGAGEGTIEAGRRLIERWGRRPLELVAKMHFCTVRSMLEK